MPHGATKKKVEKIEGRRTAEEVEGLRRLQVSDTGDERPPSTESSNSNSSTKKGKQPTIKLEDYIKDYGFGSRSTRSRSNRYDAVLASGSSDKAQQLVEKPEHRIERYSFSERTDRSGQYDLAKARRSEDRVKAAIASVSRVRDDHVAEKIAASLPNIKEIFSRAAPQKPREHPLPPLANPNGS